MGEAPAVGKGMSMAEATPHVDDVSGEPVTNGDGRAVAEKDADTEAVVRGRRAAAHAEQGGHRHAAAAACRGAAGAGGEAKKTAARGIAQSRARGTATPCPKHSSGWSPRSAAARFAVRLGIDCGGVEARLRQQSQPAATERSPRMRRRASPISGGGRALVPHVDRWRRALIRTRECPSQCDATLKKLSACLLKRVRKT